MKKVTKFCAVGLMVVSLVVVLAACATKVTSENYAKLDIGMTYSKAKSILGNPSRDETTKVKGKRSGKVVWVGRTYSHGNISKTYTATIWFENNKITSKNFATS